MGKKISIIIPCYNVEEFIDRCVVSLVNQTLGLENLELIFVNDASTDNTLELLKLYEQQFPEDILIVDLEKNIRQGGARNAGLQYASSDYIGFVDADDWVELVMFERLYEKAVLYDCDMVNCKFTRDMKEGSSMGRTGEEDRYYSIETEQDRKQLFMFGIEGGIWCNIYKKELILTNEISFPEQIAYEDNFWLPLINLYLTSYYVVEEYLYHYFVNLDSTLLSKNSLHHFDRLLIELMKIDEYKRRGVFKLYCDEIEIHFIQMYYANTIHTIFMRFDKIPLEMIELIQRTVLEKFPDYKNNCYIDSYLNNVDIYFLGFLDRTITKEEYERIAFEYRNGTLLVL